MRNLQKTRFIVSSVFLVILFFCTVTYYVNSEGLEVKQAVLLVIAKSGIILLAIFLSIPLILILSVIWKRIRKKDDSS
jgi:hypothetical protein